MPLHDVLLIILLHPHRPRLRPSPHPLPNSPREIIRPGNLRTQEIHLLVQPILALLNRQLPYPKALPENSSEPSITRRPQTFTPPFEIIPYDLVRTLASPSGPDL
jgi:hypothetical protein